MKQSLCMIFLALNLFIYGIGALPKHSERRIDREFEDNMKDHPSIRDMIEYLADHVTLKLNNGKRDEIAIDLDGAQEDDSNNDEEGDGLATISDESPGCNIQ